MFVPVVVVQIIACAAAAKNTQGIFVERFKNIALERGFRVKTAKENVVIFTRDKKMVAVLITQTFSDDVKELLSQAAFDHDACAVLISNENPRLEWDVLETQNQRDRNI